MQLLKKLCLFRLMYLALFVSGLSNSALSQTAPNQNANLSYIPSSTLFVISLNPAELAARKESQPIVEVVASFMGNAMKDVKPEQVSNLAFLILPSEVRGQSFVIRLTPSNEADADSIRSLATKARLQVSQPDPKTLLISPSEVSLSFCQLAGVDGAKNCSWAEVWNSGSACEVVFMASPSLALAGSRDANRMIQRLTDFEPRQFRTTSLEYCDWLVGKITIQNELQTTIIAQTINGMYAELLAGETRFLISRLRKIVFQGQEMLLADSEGTNNPMIKYLNELEAMLEGTKIVQSNAQVRLSMISKNGLTARLAGMSGASTNKAILSSQGRRRSANNLKQLGLAMLNYESAFKRLPAAMQIGPMDVPHSWRVTILPFLEQSKLYEKYQMAEAWDSPANAEVLKQMPEVFGDPATSETGFRVLISPTQKAGGAVFSSEPAKSGPRLADVIDGLSNTICIVDSVNTVPWTKPEGILFDGSVGLLQVSDINPKGFNVVFVDGSVRFIPANASSILLRALVTKNGGESVTADAIDYAR